MRLNADDGRAAEHTAAAVKRFDRSEPLAAHERALIDELLAIRLRGIRRGCRVDFSKAI